MDQVYYTDIELLEGLAEGSSAAIEEMYRQFHFIWKKWVLSRGGLEADADDTFQEALIIVYEKSKSKEFCLTCKLSTYLFAISKRLWYRKLEQHNYLNFKEEWEENIKTDTTNEDLEEYIEKEQKLNQLNHALDSLGEPCKSLLKGFYEERKSMQELAKTFNYTNAENAKTQKYKCLNRLKKLFFTMHLNSANIKSTN